MGQNLLHDFLEKVWKETLNGFSYCIVLGDYTVLRLLLIEWLIKLHYFFELLLSLLTIIIVINYYYYWYTCRVVNWLVKLCGINIVKKRNTKSKAWLYFGPRANEDGKIIEEEQHQPICHKCGVDICAKQRNTSNLIQHLGDHHPELLASISTGT